MRLHVIFVSKFGEDDFTVSQVPAPFREFPSSPEHWSPGRIMGETRRIVVSAETYPQLPTGKLTLCEFEEWQVGLKGVIREEAVDNTILILDMAGLCVDVALTVLDSEQHRTLLEANVTNIGPEDLGRLNLFACGNWGGTTDRPYAGQGLRFASVARPPGAFHSGQTRKYALFGTQLKAWLSYCASLSPDQYYLSICAALTTRPTVHEIQRIEGKTLATVIDELESSIENEPFN